MSQVVHLDGTDSTQDEVHRLAAEGAPAGTVVVAAVQGRGRGSRGNDWASPRGGLWMTYLARPADEQSVAVLGVRAGLCAIAALQDVAGDLPLTLKWPNDLMLGEGKLGGLLCEGRWHGGSVGWVAVGIGINVQNDLPAATRVRAARLADARPELTPAALVPALVRRLAALEHGGPALSDAERTAYDAADFLRGRRLTAPLPGKPAGLLPSGELRVVATGGEIVVVRQGPVEWEGER